MWRLIYAVPVWTLASPVKLIFILLGFIVVPIAAAFKAYKVTEVRPVGHPKHPDGDRLNWTWGWMKPWDNWEDGIACRNYHQFDSTFLQILYWSCIRNPANGLREWQPYSVIIQPNKIGYVGTKGLDIQQFKGAFPHWYFCWHGAYTCFFWQFKTSPGFMRRLWVGWKLLPQDKFGVSPTNYRIRGAAFTMQFKRREIL